MRCIVKNFGGVRGNSGESAQTASKTTADWTKFLENPENYCFPETMFAYSNKISLKIKFPRIPPHFVRGSSGEHVFALKMLQIHEYVLIAGVFDVFYIMSLFRAWNSRIVYDFYVFIMQVLHLNLVLMRKLSEACHIVVQEYQRSIKHSLFPPCSNSSYSMRLLTGRKIVVLKY